MERDNWIHRSQNMTCSICMMFVRKEKAMPPGETVVEASAVGRCRRHAPTLGGYPVVFDSDWCYDHKLDENKI